MLLDADALNDNLQERAEAMGVHGAWDASAIVAARQDAERLAAGREQDEPAAFFFAAARRSRAFGKLAGAFVPDIARAQAIAIGYELLMDDLELTMLRVGVLRGELGYDDLRAWFADCLRPLGA